MPKNVIHINSDIGNWGFSHQYVKHLIDKAGKGPITVKISSLGGDVDHALNIHDLFVAHGDCHAEIYGMTASSATILAMGCKSIKMSNNALLLVHRCAQWIDTWGRKNEEEIQSLINQLETIKDNAQKIDLQIANIYFQRSTAENKSLNAIIDDMQKDNWFTAEEAETKGYIDGRFDMKANPIPSNFAALVYNNELPPLPTNDVGYQNKTENQSSLKKIINEGFAKLNSLFTNQTMDKYPKCVKNFGVENDAALLALDFTNEDLAKMEANLPNALAPKETPENKTPENTPAENADENMLTADAVAKIVENAMKPLKDEIDAFKNGPGDDGAQAPQNQGPAGEGKGSKETDPVTSTEASFADNFAKMQKEYSA